MPSTRIETKASCSIESACGLGIGDDVGGYSCSVGIGAGTRLVSALPDSPVVMDVKDGVKLGSSFAFAEGLPLGAAEGRVVGRIDGSLAGLPLGRLLGAMDFVEDGAPLGRLDGSTLGAWLGIDVGTILGF